MKARFILLLTALLCSTQLSYADFPLLVLKPKAEKKNPTYYFAVGKTYRNMDHVPLSDLRLFSGKSDKMKAAKISNYQHDRSGGFTLGFTVESKGYDSQQAVMYSSEKKSFQLNKDRKTIEMEKVEVRKIKALFKLESGAFVLVGQSLNANPYHADKINDDFIVFIGKPGKMKQLRIKSILPYRDTNNSLDITLEDDSEIAVSDEGEGTLVVKEKEITKQKPIPMVLKRTLPIPAAIEKLKLEDPAPFVLLLELLKSAGLDQCGKKASVEDLI